MTTNKATRKLSVSRTSADPIRLEPGEAAHVDVDVHKATYHVAVLSDRRGLLAQPARPEALAERLRPIRAQVACVAHEAGPTGFGLARHLLAAGLPAQVIAPSKLL